MGRNLHGNRRKNVSEPSVKREFSSSTCVFIDCMTLSGEAVVNGLTLQG